MGKKKKKSGINGIVVGIVESIDDPTKSGRIKVRVQGYHNNIPTEQLPWCSYAGSGMFSGSGGGSISIPRVGQRVRVKFKGEDATSMEWTGASSVDKNLINEIKDDYAGSHVLLYDSAADLAIKYQPASGLLLYFGGSFIQITPDSNVMIHYGEGATGTQIQLSDGRIDVQARSQINLTTSDTINLEANLINLKGATAVQINGDKSGECAVNGVAMMSALELLAEFIDNKVPQTAGIAQTYISALKETILNNSIQYIQSK